MFKDVDVDSDYPNPYKYCNPQAFTTKLADTGRIMLCASILNALPNQVTPYIL